MIVADSTVAQNISHLSVLPSLTSADNFNGADFTGNSEA